MLDTVVISGEDVCCSVVFGTLVGVSVFSVMWSELLKTSAISYPQWYICAVLYAVLYVCVCCMQFCMSVSAVL